MLNEGVFPLIPSVYVDNSLLTAVLVGVLVLFVLGEMFGWPQSGLVVPGYLAGILVVAPEVACIIAIESLATYLLARWIIRWLPRHLPIDHAFGRDRFFLILVLSILVRLFFEAGSGSELLSGIGLGKESSLTSVGLVLVPLTANALWMPGWLKGVPLVALPVLAVYAILTGFLLPYTNLNLSHFAFSTEELSQNFLTTPKDYIVLLTATGLAARMNLRFGWEFGGILVPGLLAIAWTHPDKIFATVAEVVVMVGVLNLILRFSPMRRVNLSGLRPLVLAFVVAYVLKLFIAWQVGDAYPGLRASDLFGFGYLLPSLLVVRCWKRGSLQRILAPTLVTSLAGFLLGTLLAASLSGFQEDSETVPLTAGQSLLDQPAWRVMVDGAVPLHHRTTMGPKEFQQVIERLEAKTPSTGAGIDIDRHPDGLILRGSSENAIGRTWYRPQSTNRIVLSVPSAAMEAGLPEASVALARLMDSRALTFAAPSSLLQALDDTHVLIETRIGATSRLQIGGSLPQDLNLKALRNTLPLLEVEWTEEAQDLLLELSIDDVLELALQHFHGAVAQGRLELRDPLSPVDRPSLPTPDHLAGLSRGVLQPLFRAQTGDPRWAQIAAWHARKIGLELQEDEEAFSLKTNSFGPSPHWTLWLRKGGGSTTIEVPTAGRHYRTLRVGRTWWEATQASALLVHNAKADSDIYQAQRDGHHSYEASILRGLALAEPGLHVISVNAFMQYENPGVDALLSTGRPQMDLEIESPITAQASRLVARSGGNSKVYSAAPAELRFHDSGNVRRTAVELAGGHYLTAYLSPAFRLRFGGLSDSPSLSATVEALGLSIETQEFNDDWVEQAIDGETVSEHFAAIRDSLKRYGTTGHPGELARLQTIARKQNTRLAIWTEVEEGIPYLHAVRGTHHFLAPLSNFQSPSLGLSLDELRQQGHPLAWRAP